MMNTEVERCFGVGRCRYSVHRILSVLPGVFVSLMRVAVVAVELFAAKVDVHLFVISFICCRPIVVECHMALVVGEFLACQLVGQL